MGYYAVSLEMKDGKEIPSKWLDSLNAIKELVFVEEFRLEKDRALFIWRVAWYNFFDELIGHEQEFMDFYKFAKENMLISTECHNPNDFEYGPDSWEEFEKGLELARKDRKRNEESQDL